MVYIIVIQSEVTVWLKGASKNQKSVSPFSLRDKTGMRGYIFK
jgi:hypothetical protein